MVSTVIITLSALTFYYLRSMVRQQGRRLRSGPTALLLLVSMSLGCVFAWSQFHPFFVSDMIVCGITFATVPFIWVMAVGLQPNPSTLSRRISGVFISQEESRTTVGEPDQP